MKKVYICSPLRGNNCHMGIEFHLQLARDLCFDVMTDQTMPLAPQLYFPQFLDDSLPLQRAVGCAFALELLRECQEMIVYTGCCGISEGMRAEIAEAERLGIPITYLEEI